LPMRGTLAFDPGRNQVVLFGLEVDGTGHPVNSLIGESTTWAWNGITWLRVDSGNGPQVGDPRLVYDSARQVLVLFGGVSSAPLPSPYPLGSCCGFAPANEVWEFAGRRWTKRA
jgi:hypothetical protein